MILPSTTGELLSFPYWANELIKTIERTYIIYHKARFYLGDGKTIAMSCVAAVDLNRLSDQWQIYPMNEYILPSSQEN